MAASTALAQDSWFVSVDGKPYGPYADVQLCAFVSEGRVTAQTPVMRNGETWSPAGEHEQLIHLFVSGPPPTPQIPAPAIAAIAPAGDAIAPASEEALAKVVVIAELRTGSSIAFEAAVSRLGKSYRLNQYVWLVHTDVPLAQVRKELAAQVGRNDPLFIADTTHGRAAWINFGPGAEATIKTLWRGAG
jgi:hypothetical protein